MMDWRGEQQLSGTCLFDRQPSWLAHRHRDAFTGCQAERGARNAHQPSMERS
jgi:hypothetical protein